MRLSHRFFVVVHSTGGLSCTLSFWPWYFSCTAVSSGSESSSVS